MMFFFNTDKLSSLKGRKVNAFDFEYSFSRLIDNDVASPGRWGYVKCKRF